MAKEIIVKFGGRDFTVSALPIGPSKKWRDEVAGPFQELAVILKAANTVELNKLGDLSDVIQALSGTLLGAVDTMLDLLFSYSPALGKERAWIEENAYDEEALAAFAEVLKLAFPFGVLLEVVLGPTVSKTSSNSPSQNGTLPLPASGPRRKDRSAQK